MNIQEIFSKENTAHLMTPVDKRKYVENMVQMNWLGAYPEMTEGEFSDRSQWFRDQFLLSTESEEMLERFHEYPDDVRERIESLYLASVPKH